MASYLIDKLEALKKDDDIKEQQRVLQEQIELEIEKAQIRIGWYNYKVKNTS